MDVVVYSKRLKIISSNLVSIALFLDNSDDEEDICFMCDKNVVNTKFEPCGHSVMCEEDAHRAKRCSVCKVCLNIIIILIMYAK